MSNVMFAELKQISAEMKTIVNKTEEDGRMANREEKELLGLLSADREELLSSIVFHGYGSKH